MKSKKRIISMATAIVLALAFVVLPSASVAAAPDAAGVFSVENTQAGYNGITEYRVIPGTTNVTVVGYKRSNLAGADTATKWYIPSSVVEDGVRYNVVGIDANNVAVDRKHDVKEIVVAPNKNFTTKTLNLTNYHNLESLIVKETNLDTVTFPTGGNQATTFKHLDVSYSDVKNLPVAPLAALETILARGSKLTSIGVPQLIATLDVRETPLETLNLGNINVGTNLETLLISGMTALRSLRTPNGAAGLPARTLTINDSWAMGVGFDSAGLVSGGADDNPIAASENMQAIITSYDMDTNTAKVNAVTSNPNYRFMHFHEVQQGTPGENWYVNFGNNNVTFNRTEATVRFVGGGSDATLISCFIDFTAYHPLISKFDSLKQSDYTVRTWDVAANAAASVKDLANQYVNGLWGNSAAQSGHGMIPGTPAATSNAWSAALRALDQAMRQLIPVDLDPSNSSNYFDIMRKAQELIDSDRYTDASERAVQAAVDKVNTMLADRASDLWSIIDEYNGNTQVYPGATGDLFGPQYLQSEWQAAIDDVQKAMDQALLKGSNPKDILAKADRYKAEDYIDGEFGKTNMAQLREDLRRSNNLDEQEALAKKIQEAMDYLDGKIKDTIDKLRAEDAIKADAAKNLKENDWTWKSWDAYVAAKAELNRLMGLPANQVPQTWLDGAAAALLKAGDDLVKRPVLQYATFVQGDTDWLAWSADGTSSGSSNDKNLLGLRAQLVLDTAKGYNGGLEYSTHMQTEGWTKPVASGISGVTDASGRLIEKRMEAISIKLTGQVAEEYDVYYAVEVKGMGWLAWAKNGENAGTAGRALRAENIRVVLVKKGGPAPAALSGATEAYYEHNMPVNATYRVHSQTVGWGQGYVDGPATAGTANKRLEAINVRLAGGTSDQGGIQYQSHIQSMGWEGDWARNGAISGTTGAAKRLEAIRISLTGNIANTHDVYYRVRTQDTGWMAWTSNGQSAGTEGFARQVTGIEITVVAKGSSEAPSTAGTAFSKR